MLRRTFLGAAAAAMVTALPARAEIISLDRLSDYFNAMTTAQARFTQSADDGSRATGTLYLNRPGRARFEYDPPERALVMAGAGTVAIFDGRSNEKRPEQYPLRQTPLNLILERNVALTEGGMLVGHTLDGELTTLIARDPDNPEYGWIELRFADGPVRLEGWTIVDGAGSRTRVTLEGLSTGMDLPTTLFSIRREIAQRDR